MTEKPKSAPTFDTPPQLVPYIPQLLADMWSLSVPPETVLELLRDEECTRDISKIMDIGCGKGAISISLARQFGYQVYGLDIYAPFVDEARTRAQEFGVDEICRFENENIKKVIHIPADYDMVLLIWVGGVLGSIADSIGQIRHLIRSGGYMLIGEGCFKDGVNTEYEFQLRFIDLKATRKALTLHGDVILKEMIIPPEEISSYYREYIDSLREGAKKCSEKHPEHTELLWEYVNNHEEMCRIMVDTVDSGLWLLKKME